MRSVSLLLRLALASCLLAPARITRAGGPAGDTPLRGQRVRPWEYALTAASLTATAAMTLAAPEPGRRWRGANGFDGTVRDWLRIGSVEGRRVTARISDVLFYSLLAAPAVEIAAAWAVHGDADLAGQRSVIALESLSLAGLVSLLSEQTGRERPFVAACDPAATRAETFPSCDDGGKYTSFVSGHTLMSFTGAGLLCAHHVQLSFLGGGLADRLVCSGALAAAAAAGLFRITADKHNASDVLPAAAIGLAAGYLMPTLLHYGADAEQPATALRIAPSAGGHGALLVAAGRF